MDRDLIVGLTPFPDGGWIEFAWDGLSETMREALVAALPNGHLRYNKFTLPRTLEALARRGLVVDTDHQTFSDRGLILLGWLRSDDGAEYTDHGHYLTRPQDQTRRTE